MKTFKKLFITIEFDDVPGLFDYPKHLPIPQTGDRIHFNHQSGEVIEVKHLTTGNVTEIKIRCLAL